MHYQCPPPRNFRPAGGVRQAICSATPPPFISREPRYTGRRALGKAYESRVHEYLADRFADQYIPAQWLKFLDAHGVVRWCQPDGLIVDPVLGGICIVEVKYQHTSDAWWQLRELYLPVVSAAFGPRDWVYTTCEVVKWYDPATAFPERVTMVKSPLMTKPREFGLHIWKP